MNYATILRKRKLQDLRAQLATETDPRTRRDLKDHIDLFVEIDAAPAPSVTDDSITLVDGTARGQLMRRCAR
jgi:hypothetical protein